MSVDLEDRLERVAEVRLVAGAEARERARSAALAALPPRPSHRRRRAVLAVAAGAVSIAVALVAVLAAPWQESALATERALAALGDQPVIHAIVEQPGARETIIDLSSGRERGVAHQSEYWYDDERNVLRVRLSVDGKLLPGAEYLHSPEGFFTDRGVRQLEAARPPRLHPALEGFATRYREALESGEATVEGETVVDGRETIVLRFALQAGPARERILEDVAVDAENFRPLRFRFFRLGESSGTVSWSDAPRVVEIETIPRDPRDFRPPEPGEPRPGGQTGVEERTLTPAEAATALGRPVFWPGQTFAGIELAQIELTRLTTRWTDGQVTEGHALLFQYGASQREAHVEGKPSLIISEGTSPEEPLSFMHGGSRPGPGELALMGVGTAASSGSEMWWGSMQRDGVYISLRSPQRELILAAARAMTPLR